MKPFALFRPDSARAAADQIGEGAVFKAGGIDLLDRMKERLESPRTVVDLWALRGQLAAIRADDQGVTLGALATLADVAAATALQDPAFTAITESAADAATPQIRSRATLGGNLLQMARCWYLRSARFACAHSGRGETCLAQQGEHRYHAVLGTHDCIRVHPSNLAPPLLVFDPELHLQMPGGDRVRAMRMRDLYPAEPVASAPEHTLAPGEVLLSVRIARPAPGTRSAYRESREKQSHDWATTAAAVRIVREGEKIAAASICLGAVAPVPVLAEDAAALLVGEKPSRALFEKVAEEAYRSADPLPQNRYKVPVGKAVLIDALTAAAGAE